MIDKITAVFRKIAKVLVYISAVMLVVFTVFTVVSVFMRKVMNAPIMGFTEIAECMVAIVVFACLAYTQTENGHVSIVMILKKLPELPAMIIYTVGYCIITVFSAVAAYSLLVQCAYSYGKRLVTALVQIPLFPFYLIAGICMITFTLVLLMDTIRGFTAIAKKEQRKIISDRWV